MSVKKEPRYVLLATGAYMELNLDPDIYDSATNTKLGILSTIAGAAKKVPVTLRQAAASSSAVLLRCRVERGAGDTLETRTVNLICEADQAATAKTSLINDTLTLGGVITANWTIKKVS